MVVSGLLLGSTASTTYANEVTESVEVGRIGCNGLSTSVVDQKSLKSSKEMDVPNRHNSAFWCHW